MSISESEAPAILPPPISLTLEQALEVAGGTTFTASSVLHDYIINGIPVLAWVNPANLNPGAQHLNVGQLAGHTV